MTVDSTLLVIAPEFSTIDQADRQAVIDLAALSVGDGFGTKKELATAYLTAHMLTVRSRGGSGGMVKSLKEGELAITYDTESTKGNGATTSYYTEYLRLAKGSMAFPLTRTI